MPKSQIIYVANMSFYAFSENFILAKISEFTISSLQFYSVLSTIAQVLRKMTLKILAS